MWLKAFLSVCCIQFYSEASLLGRSSIRKSEYKSEQHIGNPQDPQCHPDYGLNVFRFLKKYHYPVENHTVTTEDGYILGLQRIPYGRHGNKTSKFQVRPAVLLIHGLGNDGIDFVVKGPNSSIGLLLADDGWDVWLGNNRGTTWSRKHVSLDPEKHQEYWNFSFHECGYYDLPAMIDYILSETHTRKLFFIGQSQGNTQFFSFAASRPEYNEKIELMVALAPCAYLNHLSSKLFRYLANNLLVIQSLLNRLGITHMSRTELITQIGKVACCDGSVYKQLCIDVFYMVGGTNPYQIDKSFLPLISYNCPAGFSMKMFIHYGQIINDGFFQQYDYSLRGNLMEYKAEHPPAYNISAITAPIAIYHSEEDVFAALPDVEKLALDLPNVVRKYMVPDKLFTHLDFIYAKDVRTLLNDAVIEHMNIYMEGVLLNHAKP